MILLPLNHLALPDSAPNCILEAVVARIVGNIVDKPIIYWLQNCVEESILDISVSRKVLRGISASPERSAWRLGLISGNGTSYRRIKVPHEVSSISFRKLGYLLNVIALYRQGIHLYHIPSGVPSSIAKDSFFKLSTFYKPEL
jgi:hypothetical protein